MRVADPLLAAATHELQTPPTGEARSAQMLSPPPGHGEGRFTRATRASGMERRPGDAAEQNDRGAAGYFAHRDGPAEH